LGRAEQQRIFVQPLIERSRWKMRMTNDEIQKKPELKMTKAIPSWRILRHSSFVILSSFACRAEV
jgi:hypothetical protein